VQKISDNLVEDRPDSAREIEVVDAEIVVDEGDSQELTKPGDKRVRSSAAVRAGTEGRVRKKAVRLYIFLPLVFLTVTLLGGLRLASPDGAFVFVAPALICLIFAVVLMVLFFRGGMVSLDGWFSDEFSTLQDAANGAVLVTLFASTVQIFNSLIPEAGLPFWIVSFCFAWSLWNTLFAEFDNKKLLKSMVALFAFAFAAKYIVLTGLTAPVSDGWLRSMIENPAKETVTWLFELPRYSAGTGYIQFFCILFYFIGLYLLPTSTAPSNNR